MDAGSNPHKNWSREQLLVLLQELSAENAQLQIELERARLERDRALIDKRLLEMNSQINKRSPGSATEEYSSSTKQQSLNYPLTNKRQERQPLKQEQRLMDPRVNTKAISKEYSSSNHHPSSTNSLTTKPMRLHKEDPTQRPKLEPSSPLPQIPGEKLNEFCLKAFSTFTNECGKMTDVENYFKLVETKYAVPNRRVLIARLRSLGERGKLVPLMGRKRKEPQVYRLPAKAQQSNLNRPLKKQKVEKEGIRKRYFIFCKHCQSVFYLTPLMKGSSFQHTCIDGVITRNLKTRGKMCNSSSHKGPCIRLAIGSERENVTNERYVRLCDRNQMYIDMKKPPDKENFEQLNDRDK